MRVHLRHARAAGFCVWGIRSWFKRFGLDFREFKENGIDEEVLLEIGDGMGIRVVEQAHAEQK